MRAPSLVTLGLFLSLGLAACGGGDEQPAPDAGVTPEAYFGLQLGRCFEYTTGDVAKSAPDLGVAVERMDTKQFAVTTYEVSYRAGGALAMTDYVAFDGASMMLYKRTFSGGKTYIYNPPLKRLTMPLIAGNVQEASTEVMVRDSAGTLLTTETHALRVDAIDVGEVQLPVGATVRASKIVFQETRADGTSAVRSEYRTFTPGAGDAAAADGFVKIDFNFSQNESAANLIYKLQKVRDLGADPTTASPLCGLAQ